MEVTGEESTKELRSRERILATAVVLFARQGFDRTGMRELARAADVNLAMINYFFGTKKKLLAEILDTFFSEYLTIARVELTGDGDVFLRLEKFISRTIYFFAARRDYLVVALTDLNHNDPDVLEYKAMWGRQMVEIVEQNVCGALGVTVTPKVMTPLLTSMMASRFLFSPVVEKISAGEADLPDFETYAQTVVAVFLHGVVPGSDSSHASV
ncbi:MAG: TetR family transcriptional regulator [Desulfuromusa sp.]|nr:TetR family transcriptional regulator [Desulfuromusa sp.]